MYTLVSLPGTCSTGINILMKTLNIPAEVVHRDELPNYKTLVPTNNVPALINGEKVIYEGAAIVLHLLEQANVAHSEFGDPAEFKQWLMFNYATLHPAYSQLFTANRLMAEGEAKAEYMATLANQISSTWQIVEQRLEQRPYILGYKVSVIDYLLAIYVNWGNFFPDYPIKLGDNVKRLVNEVSKHDVFVEAFEQEGASHAIPQGA
ncbi:glutathione S-transferase family protein [Thalassotalea marina]|uniref:Glutathione S-transferase n=1 Tax=Thalassotalea marina TaxID=1673741 RepID=A0A919BN98_9GAMM|nr:glutathione S-transferase family protein [Thalassotalea marina]GHG02897.1 glutathione S-transferase [Thalassotalea marina]